MTDPVSETFGHMPDGSPVTRITLRAGAVTARVMTYGAALQSLDLPDRHGDLQDVVLGHDDFAPYLAHRRFYGATVGRVANRIAGGRFTLDGAEHQLLTNEGSTTLHGGPDGFDRRNWTLLGMGEDEVVMGLVSPEGDQGFPGELRVTAHYALREDPQGTPRLSITLQAEGDAPCPVSLTNHSFFALAGVATLATRPKSALEMRLTVPAARYLPVDDLSLPTGVASVGATPFDFREGRMPLTAMRSGALAGYDHCLCLDGERIELVDPVSGRRMVMHTNLPGLQVYTGNYLDGSVPGKAGHAPRRHDAICLEPQHWPNAVNMPADWGAPDPVLRPGDRAETRLDLSFPAP